jgi:hypothetical protein
VRHDVVRGVGLRVVGLMCSCAVKTPGAVSELPLAHAVEIRTRRHLVPVTTQRRTGAVPQGEPLRSRSPKGGVGLEPGPVPAGLPAGSRLTAAGTGEDRAVCQDAGMDGFLLEPVRRKQLRDVLAGAPA